MNRRLRTVAAGAFLTVLAASVAAGTPAQAGQSASARCPSGSRVMTVASHPIFSATALGGSYTVVVDQSARVCANKRGTVKILSTSAKPRFAQKSTIFYSARVAKVGSRVNQHGGRRPFAIQRTSLRMTFRLGTDVCLPFVGCHYVGKTDTVDVDVEAAYGPRGTVLYQSD